jgi:hypothetical protein
MPSRPIPELIAEAERHDKAATPGPWNVLPGSAFLVQGDPYKGPGVAEFEDPQASGEHDYTKVHPNEDWDRFKANAKLCAFARTALPEMAEALRRRERALEIAFAALDDLSDGACDSRYGPGCDARCKNRAYRGLDDAKAALSGKDRGGDHE